MAIYGTPLTMGGGGGSNDTLPPLLDNFKATRLEGGIVPPTANTLAFKDIPDGSKIKLVKGNNISGTVTYGTTTDLNHRIVFDSNDWTRKQFQLENNSKHTTIYDSDIDLWLNSTKASDWWGATNLPYAGDIDPYHTNSTPPDYANDEGFLYQLGITDEVLAQNFNDININATAKAKVALPWTAVVSDYIPYTFFDQMSYEIGARYIKLLGDSGDEITRIEVPRTRVADIEPFCGAIGMLFPMMEPKPETPVALDSDGSYFMFEKQTSIILSADKMEESRAKDLAGAVWVYSDHIPQNKNDGTKIELARDEVINPDAAPFITLADIPVSDADTETVVNLKEADGKLHPYLYLHHNYENSNAGLLLRKDCYTKGVFHTGNIGPFSGSQYDTWCSSTFPLLLDASVYEKLMKVRLTSLNAQINRKCFPLSYKEYGGELAFDEGTGFAYFKSDERRKAYINGETTWYWTRSKETVPEGYAIDADGRTTKAPNNLSLGYRPAFCLPLTFKLNPTPNKDGSYDMYEESSAQTLATGKTIADLPSKSKVKLGKFSGIPLKWLVCRDSVDQSLRLILDGESVVVIGNKMFDNHEPNNPDSNRRNYGNNRYIWSNIRQWLNSDKPANQWYTAQHTYDAAPDYTNVAGFLHEWTEKEISVLENASWVVTKHSVDGGGSESFQSKVALPSTTEMGLESNTGGARIDIFNNNEDRVVSGVPYWCRTPYSSNAYDACTIHTGGTLHHYRTDNTGYGVRPLCKPVASTLVSNEPDSDGCYTLVFTPPLERTVVWDKKKEFYARQFTYNGKKQYQTMLKGAVSYLPIMPDGQELSKLPSKSKVKLGRYGDADLQWLVSRNAENKLILALDSNSISALGNKMLDAAEPSNGNSDRQKYGNNRCIYTNLHQWLNAEKGANQWFVKAHNADTPPDYQNQAGFLNGWKKEELDLLELAEWTVTKSGTDGSGKETFRSRVVLPSTTEMGFSSEGGGSKLDIFNSDSDRQTGSTYWTRTPFPTSPCINYQVKSDGTQYSGGYNSYDGAIRPICSIPETTLVSIETDSEGCFTLV